MRVAAPRATPADTATWFTAVSSRSAARSAAAETLKGRGRVVAMRGCTGARVPFPAAKAASAASAAVTLGESAATVPSTAPPRRSVNVPFRARWSLARTVFTCTAAAVPLSVDAEIRSSGTSLVTSSDGNDTRHVHAPLPSMAHRRVTRTSMKGATPTPCAVAWSARTRPPSSRDSFSTAASTSAAEALWGSATDVAPVAPACPALRLRAKTPRTGCVAAMRTATVTLLLLPLDRFPSPVMAGTADVPGVNATSHTNCSSEAPAWFPATARPLTVRLTRISRQASSGNARRAVATTSAVASAGRGAVTWGPICRRNVPPRTRSPLGATAW